MILVTGLLYTALLCLEEKIGDLHDAVLAALAQMWRYYRAESRMRKALAGAFRRDLGDSENNS